MWCVAKKCRIDVVRIVRLNVGCKRRFTFAVFDASFKGVTTFSFIHTCVVCWGNAAEAGERLTIPCTICYYTGSFVLLNRSQHERKTYHEDDLATFED